MTKTAENKPNANLSEVGRFREIISVVLKHGIIKGITPEKLRITIEELGPTFIKFGQILSTRPDMIPVQYCDELAKLRGDVSPMEYSQLEWIIEEEYKAPVLEVFASFDKEPLGSASIAQVHKGTLKDGAVVAVKVQRYGIRETMARDIKLMHRAAKFLKITNLGELFDIDNIIDEIWAAAQQETDFLMESKNADEFWKNNTDVAFFHCPEVIHRYTTSKILVMRYIEGTEINNKEKLVAEGYDLNEIALKLADNYIKQVLDDGYFHADPHPGNLLVGDGKIVWLDLGMMGRLSLKDQKLLREGVKAAANKDIDEIENVILKMSPHSSHVDREKFRADLTTLFDKYWQMELGDINIGLIMEEVAEVARKYRLAIPGGFFLLGRGLLNINGVLINLSPEINVPQLIASQMSKAFLKDFDVKEIMQKSANWLMVSGQKSAEIPALLSDFLKIFNSGRSKLNLRVGHAEESLKTVDKIANRFIKCIFAAALFLGGCMMCLSDIQPKIFGVHLIGWVAFALSIILGINVLFEMRKK